MPQACVKPADSQDGMIGGSISSGLVSSGSARGGLLGASMPGKPVEAHFSSKLSGSFTTSFNEFQPGSSFTLRPATHKLMDVANGTGTEDIKGAAQQMESYFIYLMLKEMWATLPEDSFLDSGLATDIFQQMWLEKVSDQLATSGPGIGLATVFERDIQSKATTAPPQIVQPTAIPIASDNSAKPFPFNTSTAPAIRPPVPATAPLGHVSTPLAIPPLEAKIVARVVNSAAPIAIRPPVPPAATPMDLFSSQAAVPQTPTPTDSLFTKPIPLPGTITEVAEKIPADPVIQAKPKPTPAPRPKPSGG